ncbi:MULTISPECIES: 23S rRNA (pseudouridine(1915)-N(3))-methyltransferase RlmH [unclassified Methanoregula]|uniref:23S rRNA (pseudouridine(1915)-N(3))-methyltransferase RlmH n=1 Tax=unclassified Methanoregula TaxID=2649730 RepID=UPI0009D2BE7F|nr:MULTISPECIES: 23S rRNA (pseudouridine(1915)-N(3))-methyltransferase RlmH [unclassified Methanoregula]OPX64189.1 MAG: rRNA large subunit methyltransferase [Methanoregula sp. PtaB.Bin085]OPY34691.1 MAG: rRNA large subunit methyltransferase [Methanoregula sp. PtaU1.Bin006]
MHIRIIAVGRIKERFLQEGIAEYEKRLRPYAKLQITELSEEKRSPAASPATESAALDREGQRILAEIPEGSLVIALDIKGQNWTSEDLANGFRVWQLAGRSPVAFVIGGDLGLSPMVIDRSDLRLSLSKMTFTHPMARLILLEQVYRAFRILRGEPYHK